MKKVLVILFFVILFVLQGTKVLSLSLYINSPRTSFSKYPGTIEALTITVKPHGTFIEAGVYLTISPVGSIYSSVKDTLEAVLEFELNEKAFINDTWLFLDDTTYVQGKLMDKWTAGLIYEGIVKRMKDPSILYKIENGKFKIKIFPLIGNSTRTVKINCFLPCAWSSDKVVATLPNNLLNASYTKPSKIRIFAYPDEAFKNPAFADNPYIKFQPNENLRYGKSKMAELLPDLMNGFQFKFSHDFNQGFFGNLYQGTKENFYQYVLELRNILKNPSPRRIAFLIDYDINKSYISKKKLLESLKNTIYRRMNPLDSFNIIMSNNPIYHLSYNWLPADTPTVESVFNYLQDTMLCSASCLHQLLLEGVSWADKNSDTALVLLISNTDQHGSQSIANHLAETVLGEIENEISLNVCSFTQKNWITNYIANTAYYGNDYLYSSLVGITRGVFNKIGDNQNDMEQLINNTLISMLGGYEGVNITTTLSDGYIYDKVLLDNSMADLMKTTNYIEYGKFKGNPPVYVDLTGVYRKVPFHARYNFNYDYFSDRYDNRSIWAGSSLRSMEQTKNPQYTTVYEIIKKSLEYNVLSVYTAFLAKDDYELKHLEKDENIVPVELMFFNGFARQHSIELYWATASEINNHGFFIDKRIEGTEDNFESVGFIKGNGTTKIVNHYNFSDKNVTPGKTYQYRLRQVDIDGTVQSGTQILSIKYEGPENLQLVQNFPNPFKLETTIRFSLPQESYVKLEVLDLFGNPVVTIINQSLRADDYEVVWNGSNSRNEPLPGGMYICRLSAGKDTKIIRMLLSK